MDKLAVTIVDIQPIDPPIGGGRLRLLGLYSGFKNNIEATYIGSYDWRGPEYRDHMLSECLREINVPLSEAHFTAHDELSELLGKPCVDTAFSIQGHLSEEYVKTVQEHVKSANVVILSHPWAFPYVQPTVDSAKQLLVYDSQNNEGRLRMELLDDGSETSEKVLREVVRCEWELCHAADLIFACSQEDKQSFVDLYDVDEAKIIIVPNGVFTSKLMPCENTEEKMKIRERIGLELPAACFIGSNYYPNEEAARLILNVSPELPQYQFVIIGGVGNALDDIDVEDYPNVIITGFVSEDEMRDYLQACDIAINPMLSGSGTNIKMFDFMATGLPIITTSIGARGIPNKGGNLYILCELSMESLIFEVGNLFANMDRQKQLIQNGRREACEKYSWEQISYELGYKLKQKYKKHINSSPVFFSVVIPTYERHDYLHVLLKNLQKQTEKDFEVIIIDQSKEKFNRLSEFADLDIVYFRTDVKGAVKARNTGISLANADVVAFIDDDCIPDENWLNNAKKYFEDPATIGVEGMIEADIYDSEAYRVVANVGVEGLGFMTANLFVKLEVLQKIRGFDEEFDNPHFREDTDLGWRALEFGKIPYAKDVKVLHPSHKRDSTRESAEERNKFYVHDPLLMKKHPCKFIDLYLREVNYNKPDYWPYFKKGVRRHNTYDNLPEFLFNENVLEVTPDQITLELLEIKAEEYHI